MPCCQVSLRKNSTPPLREPLEKFGKPLGRNAEQSARAIGHKKIAPPKARGTPLGVLLPMWGMCLERGSKVHVFLRGVVVCECSLHVAALMVRCSELVSDCINDLFLRSAER